MSNAISILVRPSDIEGTRVQTEIKIACWNVEWAKPGSKRLGSMLEILLGSSPSVVCLTEAYSGSLDDRWHMIESDPDYGYRLIDGRRKVMLASSSPWLSVDRLGDPALPEGRFVSGTTEVNGTVFQVIGVCIPWSHAHVNTGRKDRLPWEDHTAFITGMASILKSAASNMPTVIVGDFNQTIPRSRAPVRVFEALQNFVLPHATAATEGLVDEHNARAIDHILYSGQLIMSSRNAFERHSPTGLRLSDHFGVGASLRLAG